MAVRLGNVLFWASFLIVASVLLVGRGIAPYDMSLKTYLQAQPISRATTAIP
jgi:hypothetical protein